MNDPTEQDPTTVPIGSADGQEPSTVPAGSVSGLGEKRKRGRKPRQFPPSSHNLVEPPHHIATPDAPEHIPSGKREIKRYLITLINERPLESVFSNVSEVLYLSQLPSLNNPESDLWKEFLSDKDLLFAIQRRRQERIMDLRATCEALGRKGNDKMMSMALKLLASEEELARIGGGGIKLDDVKKLGQSSRQQINVLIAGNTPQQRPDSEPAPTTKAPRKTLRINLPSPDEATVPSGSATGQDGIEDAVIIE